MVVREHFSFANVAVQVLQQVYVLLVDHLARGFARRILLQPQVLGELLQDLHLLSDHRRL